MSGARTVRGIKMRVDASLVMIDPDAVGNFQFF